jgi:DNA polymerase-3 subunit epsilon
MLPRRTAFLDLETTGADPREDQITEIGLVLVDNGQIEEEWSTLINPGREIPPGIETLTGITNAMVSSAPRFGEVSLDLAARLEGRLLVAHNARFDHAFLRQAFRRVGMPYDPPVLCTVRLSRRLFPHHRHHNLDSLVERFALSCEARHRALPDARVLVDLTRAFAHSAEPAEFAAALAAATQSPQRPDGFNAASLDDLPEAPGVYQLHDAQGQALFVGRATNLRTQVLAHWSDTGRNGRELRAALQAGSLEWIVTAGPLGTALRQLQLIKCNAPRLNRPPRAHDDAWALHWPPGAAAVESVDLNAADTPAEDLFGPFRSRQDALRAVRGLSREFGLCPQAVGLEAGVGACSARVSGQCRGVCTGDETRAAHALRLIEALSRLRLPAWPFPDAVAIVEQDSARTRRELHLAHQWRYLGSVRSEEEARDALASRIPLPAFRVDVFRLLQRALKPPSPYSVRGLGAGWKIDR